MSRSQSKERRYTISGMTCAHCVAAVSAEVGGVRGVTSVDVDLASGSLDVRGDSFTDDAIAEAVAEAGYDVVVSGA